MRHFSVNYFVTDYKTFFDAEFLPHVRSGDRHFVRATYVPESCGSHEIIVEAIGGNRTRGDALSLLLDVDLDFVAAVDYLFDELAGIRLAFPGKAGHAHVNNLRRDLTRAREAFEDEAIWQGSFHLGKFRERVEVLDRHGRIDPAKAYRLIAHASETIGCAEDM